MSYSAIWAGLSSETFGIQHQSKPTEASVAGECWESLWMRSDTGITLILGMRIHGKLEHISYTLKAQLWCELGCKEPALCGHITPQYKAKQGEIGGLL